jgi:hypothetical protein
MKKNNDQTDMTYSYLALRKAVGWIGILLPVALVLGMLLIFKEDPLLRNISVYYHTGMRDLLVGTLCSIALFLFFYKGYDKWDNIAATLAGICALGVAFFPTVKEGEYNWVAYVHYYCAAGFLTILALISLFLFTRKESNPTKRKMKRNIIYILCGSIMLVSLMSIEVFFLFFEDKNPDSSFVFWAETTALVAFGVSWLTKGGTLYPDRKTDGQSFKTMQDKPVTSNRE